MRSKYRLISFTRGHYFELGNHFVSAPLKIHSFQQMTLIEPFEALAAGFDLKSGQFDLSEMHLLSFYHLPVERWSLKDEVCFANRDSPQDISPSCVLSYSRSSIH